jgi:hypothetical protein
METVQSQSLLINKEQIISPLVEVLNTVTQKLPDKARPSKPLSQSINESLENLFPEQTYDGKNIQKAKGILGDLAKSLTTEQLKDAIVEIQFLAESWLDDFEREIFKGITLRELLHEKESI